jgi:pyruvate formate lyase activating enzyme
MSKPLKDMKPYLDAAVVDFKGNNEKFYREFSMADLNEVKKGALRYKRLGIHMEITNLVVPGHNDNLEELREQIKWIYKKIGKNTPYHILRFFPTQQMAKPGPTDVNTLEKVYEIAKEEGMNYVYIGNLNSKHNNTYCPKCYTLLIERKFMHATEINITKDKRCPKCGNKIPVVM